MALWRYVMVYPDGRRESNVLSAGNRVGAMERSQRNAAAKGATLVAEPILVGSPDDVL